MVSDEEQLRRKRRCDAYMQAAETHEAARLLHLETAQHLEENGDTAKAEHERALAEEQRVKAGRARRKAARALGR